MTDTQADDELALFGRFLRARAITADTDSYTKRAPPEPDILFIHPSEGPTAFEVAEIVDQNWARIRGSRRTTDDALRATFESLSEPAKSRIAAAYRNATIGFHFKPGKSRNQRLNKLPRIFEELALLPADTTGPALDEHPACSDVLFNLYIVRLRTSSGPDFHSSDVTSVGDPTVDIIRDKIAKAHSYRTTAPIELLTYMDASAAEFPDDVWRTNVAQYFASQSDIRFRRVWIFNIRTDIAHLVFGT